MGTEAATRSGGEATRTAARGADTRRIAWLFLLPNLVTFGLFVFLPIGFNFFYALTGGDRILPSERPDAGLDNFTTLLTCTDYMVPATCTRDLFWRALFNTALFVVIQVVAMVGFALLTALILNREIRARGFFRAVFFFPVLLSPVVVALVWKWILQREGLLNAAMFAFGLDARPWLLDASWAFFWVLFVSVWAHMGFYTLIVLAGLQAIPRDIYEAAEMDAATPWRVFYRLTLPLLMPNLLVVLVLALIKGVQTFDEVYALNGGGPGSATMLMVQYIYETGFAGQPRLYGLAAAASILLAVVLMILTLAQLALTRKNARG
jgi:alpha-1,4-digalacturonate transport system permease protein